MLKKKHGMFPQTVHTCKFKLNINILYYNRSVRIHREMRTKKKKKMIIIIRVRRKIIHI